MIKKEDFDLVLKETVLKAWEEIQKIMNQFTYFKNMDVVMKRECSIVSRTKVFQPDETILGDGTGLTNFVHFITKGTCCIIEHLVVRVSVINGIKHYYMYKSQRTEDEDDESKFERSMTLNRSISTNRPSRATVTLMGSQVSAPKQSVDLFAKKERVSERKSTQLKKKRIRRGTRQMNATTSKQATATTKVSRVGIMEPTISEDRTFAGKYFLFFF